MSPLEALVALNMLTGIGPIRARRLLHSFGTPASVLRADPTKLQQVRGIGPELARQIQQGREHVDPATEIEECRQRGIRILPQDHPSYPPLLQHLPDAPLLLYCRGELQPGDELAIGVVGSRRCSHYGIQSTRQLSYSLAAQGITLVSGLARGIDTAAHQAALAAGGRTIAIIGSGLAQLYPAENQALADAIADGKGAVLSEYPLHTRPDKHTFPMRNRIIAGCSQAILVIECPSRSGAQITANQAAEFGRPVYAVPGPIDRPSFAGSHELIRDGAILVTAATEILAEFGVYQTQQAGRIEQQARPRSDQGHDQETCNILDEIDSSGITIDELVERCRLPASRISRTLLKLELQGEIRGEAGARYVLIGSRSS